MVKGTALASVKKDRQKVKSKKIGLRNSPSQQNRVVVGHNKCNLTRRLGASGVRIEVPVQPRGYC